MTKKHLFQNGLALFVCLFLFAGGLFAQEYTHIELVTSSQNWVVPTTLNGNNIVVTSVKFEGVGGGGAGGFVKGNDSDGDNYLYQVAGSGGGGAYAATNFITDMTAGEPFAITVGAGGYNHASLVTEEEWRNDIHCGILGLEHCTEAWKGVIPFTAFIWASVDWSDAWIPMPTALTWYVYPFYKNRVEGHGGTTMVKRGGTTLLSAGGGQTCLGVNNPVGAAGGIATVGDFLGNGGKGGDATGRCSGLLGNMSTGGGGGAGNPAGINNNGEDAICAANSGWGHGGQGYDSGDGYPICGAGARGTSDFNDVLGGPGSGYAGDNYGGGGGGAKSGTLNWHRGGPGAPGVVKVTYTYTIVPNESIDITTDASGVAGTATICSGADFDVALNITADGFNLSDATVIPNSTSNPSLSVSAGTSFNTTDGKWHVTGSITNFTSTTIEYPISVTVKTPSENDEATATVNITVYGKLDGGVIGVDQAVCNGMTIQTLKGDGTSLVSPYYGNITTAKATGGSNSCEYRWYRNTQNLETGVWSGYEIVTGANAENYTPSGQGIFNFKREYVDNVCGTSEYATDGSLGDYLIVVTELPFTWDETYSANDTICSNENYTFNLHASTSSPFYSGDNTLVYEAHWRVQKSMDKGATWENTSSTWDDFDQYPTYTPADYQPGDDIWYRWVHKFNDCDSIPSNVIYKLHVKEAPDYTNQFEDLTITLWYGACDTSIANLPAPDLSPTPAEIIGPECAEGPRLAPGTYTISWNVKPFDDCELYTTYEQQLTVEYPECGTIEEPLTVFDEDGNEYQTIRIGCDCWFAENLKSYSENSSYYDDDAANAPFGKLYNWNDAVGSNNEELPTMLGTTYIQGICPDGWAIPTVEQYTTMMSVAGEAEDIKSDDANAWLPDLVGTNTVGFAAMGAGFYSGMEYQRLLGYTDFWTADDNESNSSVAKAMELRPGCDELLPVDKNKADKLSVRCVRVEPAEPEEFTCGTSTVKDANGNTYSTVLIGEQCWTKSNLRTTKYADGTTIANTAYHIDPASYNPAYGYLYTWEVVSNTAGLCPTGWHVSTKEDWQTLGSNITSNKDIAAKSGWLVSPNQNMIGYEQESTNNSTKFSAFPAGQFNANSYQSVNRLATFWTNTEYNENNAWFVSLNALMPTSWPTAAGLKTWSRSVRCVKNAD